MSLTRCLLHARSLVASGWCEPLPRRADGTLTHAHDEAAKTFDVSSAIRMTSQGIEEYLQAHELLESIVCPNRAALDRLALQVSQDWPELTSEDVAAVARFADRDCESLAAWLQRPGRPLEHVLKMFDTALLRAKTLEAA